MPKYTKYLVRMGFSLFPLPVADSDKHSAILQLLHKDYSIQVLIHTAIHHTIMPYMQHCALLFAGHALLAVPHYNVLRQVVLKYFFKDLNSGLDLCKIPKLLKAAVWAVKLNLF